MARPPTRRTLLALLALVPAGALGAASGPAGGAGSGETKAGEGAPATARGTSGGTLRFRLWRPPDGLDPAFAWGIEAETITLNIYNGLVGYDPRTSAFVPELAEKWETADGRVWRFSLRRGVQWQHGFGPFAARDVVYSYERIRDPRVGSLYASEFANVEALEAPDEHTVVVTLKGPDYGFLHAVANYHQGQIVKREAVEKWGEQYRQHAVGTGPFQLESWTQNAEARLTRFDAHWKGPAKLDGVTYRVIADDATAEIALLNRELDVARNSAPESLTRLVKEERLQMFERKGLSVSVMVPNAQVKPLDNPLARKAMAHAMDLEKINQVTSGGFTSFAWNLLPSTNAAYTKDVPRYPYDPKKARDLLQEAGLKSGFSIKDLGAPSDASLLMQRDLAAVGIALEFENVTDRALNNQRRNNGQFQLSGRLTPGVNPDSLLWQYLHPSAFPPVGLNGARYAGAEVAALLEQVRREADERKRLALHHAIQKRAMEDLPYIVRSENNNYYPAWKNVHGIQVNGLEQVPLHEVTLEPA